MNSYFGTEYHFPTAATKAATGTGNGILYASVDSGFPESTLFGLDLIQGGFAKNTIFGFAHETHRTLQARYYPP